MRTINLPTRQKGSLPNSSNHELLLDNYQIPFCSYSLQVIDNMNWQNVQFFSFHFVLL
jgi:hypothetical protein